MKNDEDDEALMWHLKKLWKKYSMSRSKHAMKFSNANAT